MMQTKVSIIIPVYNVEKYLEQCLDSVVNQTLEDIEIICVNDGSTDDSLKILEKYASKDKRIKIITQENKGLSGARNTGIKHAKGKYVNFLDSDDWMDINALDFLYSKAESNNTDLIIYQMINYDEHEDRFYNTDVYDLICVENFFNIVTNCKELGEKIFCITVTAYNKFYNRNFFESINSEFPEGLIFEDNPIFYESIFNAKRTLIVDKYFIYRRRHGNSITSLTNEKHFDIIPITNMIVDFFINNNLFEKFKKQLLNKKITMLREVYNNLDEKFKSDFLILLNEDFSINETNKLLNEDYKNNLNEINEYFYLNSQKTVNFKEFDLLNKLSYIEPRFKISKTNYHKFKKFHQDLKIKYTKIESENIEILKNLKEIRNENNELKKQNKLLGRQNNKLSNNNNKFKDELNKIYSSNSWKMTKYLRIIMKKIKR